MSECSRAQLLCESLVRDVGREGASRMLRAMLSEFSNTELAALAANWRFWARPKQLPPAHSWRSWGFLTGRGFGKTKAISHYVNEEVQAGRAMLIGLAAQDEDNCIALQVQGPSGLIATAPPWFKPKWEATGLQLVWPNGARAYVRTPQVPGKIRGLEYHLSWICELQSWPAAHRQEAYDNFLFSTRLGYARIVWDATPKRRHPIIKALLAEEDARHVIIRGRMKENEDNLSEDYVRELLKKFAGTTRGKEELDGEQLDDDEKGLVRQDVIDNKRSDCPTAFLRKGVGIDVAVTKRDGSDRTGISFVGLGVDDRLYVLADHSGKWTPDEWATIALDTYVNEGCDIIVVETNKGGDLVTQNLRAAAKTWKAPNGDVKPLKVVVVNDKWRPHREEGVVFVREVYSRGEKADRAQPLATAYERGRISHVFGRDLVTLEDLLTTWVPESGQRSPDNIEALVHIAGELLNLTADVKESKKEGFVGLQQLSAKVASNAPAPTAVANLAILFGGLGFGNGGRI